jgi:hypothetical protein
LSTSVSTLLMKNDATLSIPDRSISGCPLRQPGHERVLLGSDYSIGWTGSAYQELSTAGTGYQGFLFGSSLYSPRNTSVGHCHSRC